MTILKPSNEVDVPVELGDVHCTLGLLLPWNNKDLIEATTSSVPQATLFGTGH